MPLPLLSFFPVYLSVYLSALLALSFGAETGSLSAVCDGTYHVEWKIPRFFSLPSNVGNYVYSSKFHSHNWDSARFLKRSELLKRRSELAPGDTLTILLTMDVDDSQSPKETHSEEGKYSNKQMTVDVDILQQHLRKLLLVGPGYDVTFKMKDGDIRAHKAVLIARSPVFASTFGSNKTESCSYVIYIEDCKPDAFREFLLYLYCGKADNISLDNVYDLYKAAHKYRFPELKTQCVQFMNISLSAESSSDVMQLAAKYNETGLLEKATNFLGKNIKDILVTTGWKHFLQQNPLAANELYIKALDTCYDKN